MHIAAQPYITATLRDASGSAGEIRLYVRRGVNAPPALAAFSALAGAIAAISGCTIVAVRIEYSVKVSPAPGVAPGPGLRRGVLLFDAAPAPALAGIVIPGIDPALVETVGPGAGIDLIATAPPLAALITAISMGPWSDPFGGDIGLYRLGYIEERGI